MIEALEQWLQGDNTHLWIVVVNQIAAITAVILTVAVVKWVRR